MFTIQNETFQFIRHFLCLSFLLSKHNNTNKTTMIELAIWTIFTILGAASLALSSINVKWPSKWVWIIISSMLTGYSLASALYTTGGKYSLLLPFFLPAMVAIQTTGTLALCVGIYSSIQGPNRISPQWYALPTGASPLGMLHQYIPPQYIQIALLGATTLFAFSKKSPLGVPLGVMLGGVVCVDVLGVKVPVGGVSEEMVVVGGFVVGTLLLLLSVTGSNIQSSTGITITKKKKFW